MALGRVGHGNGVKLWHDLGGALMWTIMKKKNTQRDKVLPYLRSPLHWRTLWLGRSVSLSPSPTARETIRKIELPWHSPKGALKDIGRICQITATHWQSQGTINACCMLSKNLSGSAYATKTRACTGGLCFSKVHNDMPATTGIMVLIPIQISLCFCGLKQWKSPT